MRPKESKCRLIPGQKINSLSLSKIKKNFSRNIYSWVEPNHEVEATEVAACRSVEELRQTSSPVASLGSCLCSMQSLEISSLPSTEFTGISHSTQLGGLLSLCQCWVPPVTVLHSRRPLIIYRTMCEFSLVMSYCHSSSSSYVYCQLEK